MRHHHRTVKRVAEKFKAGEAAPPRVERAHNYDAVAELVAERVKKSQGRLSAKRMPPIARAAGYDGSARNFRRLVAEAKVLWRNEHHRGRRPAVWSPGEYLVIDWAQAAPGLFLFCAVLAFSIGIIVDSAVAPSSVSAIVGWIAVLAALFLVLTTVYRIGAAADVRHRPRITSAPCRVERQDP